MCSINVCCFSRVPVVMDAEAETKLDTTGLDWQRNWSRESRHDDILCGKVLPTAVTLSPNFFTATPTSPIIPHWMARAERGSWNILKHTAYIHNFVKLGKYIQNAYKGFIHSMLAPPWKPFCITFLLFLGASSIRTPNQSMVQSLIFCLIYTPLVNIIDMVFFSRVHL